MESLGLRETKATRVKWELGDYPEHQETWQVSFLNLVNRGNLERKEKRAIKENQEMLVQEGYLENKALRVPLDNRDLKVTLDFLENKEELVTQALLASLVLKVLVVYRAMWVSLASSGLLVQLDSEETREIQVNQDNLVP